jgi:hypothetical protein
VTVTCANRALLLARGALPGVKSGAGDALRTISDRPVWQKSVAKGYGVGGAEAIFELVVGADTGGLVVDPHSAETALDQ